MTVTETGQRPAGYGLAPADPVGIAEVRTRMGVAPHTLRKWRAEPEFPQPRWTISDRPVWDWTDILIWCAQAERFPDPDAPDVPVPQPHRTPVSLADADPVGVTEIYERLGVVRGTVNEWRRRTNVGFPPARWVIGTHPAWDWNADIVAWTKATGRAHLVTAA